MAAECYRRAAGSNPDRWLTRLRADSLAEPIAPSEAWIDEYRGRLGERLERYRGETRPIDSALLNRSSAEPPMALAYHGRLDRPLKEAWAQLFLDRIPDPGRPPVPPGKPKLGIVVTAGHEGVYDRCFGNVADRLAARGHLDVVLVSTRAGINVLRHLRPSFCGGYLEIPDGIDAAAESIRAAACSVLYYWEVGTDSMNYFLPFFRPAAVQVAGWGWPSTSGNPRVDFFLGSNRIDPLDAHLHHSERIVTIPELPTLYDLGSVPAAASRADLGIPDSSHLYLCVQNMRKLTPEFDRVLATIARADPLARMAVIADERKRITEEWLARVRRDAGDVDERLVVFSRRDRDAYRGLLRAADVVLDSIGYGGGANTAADCAACGAPVVTLRGEFHRGRWQAAVNERHGVPELNAPRETDYVETATRIAGDPAIRGSLRQRIEAAAKDVFESDRPVEQFEAAFLGMISPTVCCYSSAESVAP